MHILRLDATARQNGSITRALNDEIIERLKGLGSVEVLERNLSEALPQLSETWIGANFTAPEDRSEAQTRELGLSDQLIAEVEKADVLLIGLPIYNFGVPAALKSWIDHIARAGVTFRYTENGPEGLLKGKRAIVAVASGGTELGSDYDFATGYLRHVLGFVGITDVVFVAADKMAVDADASLAAARQNIADLKLAA